MSKTLGVICARKGSKRLPGKNLQRINGITLVENAAKVLHDGGISPIVIACDFELDFDPGTYQAQHLFRPENTSADHVALQETVKWAYHSLDQEYDYIVFLMPNCPMITPLAVSKAASMVQNESFNVVRSYDNEGHENGLVAVRTKYLMDHFIDVYCGSVICEGKEIHDKQDYLNVKKNMEKVQNGPME